MGFFLRTLGWCGYPYCTLAFPMNPSSFTCTLGINGVFPKIHSLLKTSSTQAIDLPPRVIAQQYQLFAPTNIHLPISVLPQIRFTFPPTVMLDSFFSSLADR